ncbi:MAG: sugar phosphate nucleotidyltransferase [Candidatus Nanohaloarchaea archaeon]|nr:sugar phosphate nucleotidyltransferase [Candidatus Nanohaloarchaea archaeon]
MGKKRVSITLEEELVERIDRKAEEKEIENRSRAIESFLSDYLRTEKVDTAVVLCGGTVDPECMIRINGKPVVEHILTHLDKHGVERAVLTVNKEDKSVKDYFGDGKGFDLDLEYFVEEQPLGTAGSLREIEGLNDTFLMMNGDVLCRVDIEDMARKHRESKAVSTIALTTIDDVSPYGVARMKGDKIVGFTEKPEKGEEVSKLVNAGVYLMEPEAIKRLPEKREKQKVDVEDVFERLAGQRLLKGYVYDGEWHDVGKRG